MFEFMKNLFASEQPILEKYNIVDPEAVGGDKVRSVTVALTPPIENASSTSVSLFWSDSENKVYEKDFENKEEAQKIFESIKSDLHEVAELTKEEKLDAAEGLITELMSRYDIHTDKLVEGNPPPPTTTMANKKGTRVKYLGGGSQEGELLNTPDDFGWVKVMWDDGDITDEDFYDSLQVIAFKKKAKVVMQNVFFDTPEEAAAFSEKMKKKEPGIGDKPPMAGDFEDDLPMGDDKDLDLGDENGDIGPPSLSHKDFEKDKAKEQKSLTKRIEKEVKDQVKSNLDQKVASTFSEKEDALLDALRGVGRTWEEIREYFVKGLKYDEDSVVYYLDQRKGVESPELVEDKPEIPKPPENLVTPETHDELIDDLLDDKKPIAPEVKEIEKKDIPIKDKEIANSLDIEIEKKAEEPLETTPSSTPSTSKDMYPKTEFENTSDDMDQITEAPVEIGDMPQEEIPEMFHPGESVYVMGDYETGTKGYEGEFVSEYKSDGEDYAVIDIGMNEMKEVPKRFVKKASYKDLLKKKAVTKCEKCDQALTGEEYMVCTDCKGEAKKELVMANQIKACVGKELADRALNLIKADIDELKESVDKESADPVMEPATDPSQTTEEVPTKHRELKIHPKDTKTKDIEMANAKAQKAYDSFLTSKQRLANIETDISKIKLKADEDIKKVREESKQQKEQKLFQSAVERMASLVEVTKDKVMRVGSVLFTFIKEIKEKKEKIPDKEKLQKLYNYFVGAEEYIKKLEAESDAAVKTTTKKELVETPYRESALTKKEAGLQDMLESIWDGLKTVYDMSIDVEKELGAVAVKDPKVEKKAYELKLWNPSEGYMGEEYPDYYMGPARTRDSESMEESNFNSALKQLGGENDGVMVQRAGHWAVGWVEVILVHKDAKEKLAILQNIMNQIEEYPVLDEEDYSEIEQNKYDEAINDWAFDDAVEIMGFNIEEMSEQQKTTLIRAIQDTFGHFGELHLDKKILKSYYEEGTDIVHQREEYSKTNPIPESGKEPIGE